MTGNDISILAKKILVGFIIFLVPVSVIAGGLWILQQVLAR
ncbi:MAG: hypothetical protein QM791_07605 [Ferruginibacter sp.]